MLSHDNLIFTYMQQILLISKESEFNDEERVVSYLPLSHIAGFGMDVMSSLIVGSSLYFARPDAL